MKIIISGSNGFIGHNLMSILSSENYSIFSIDTSNGLDLTRREIFNKTPEFDVFVHLANLSYVPDSYSDPETFYRINFLTTLNALELCRKNNARLIYLSSYIYGIPKFLPVDETHPVNPFNPYAQSKYLCESLCDGYYRDFGVKTTIFRPFNVYGIGQTGHLLIPEIFKQLCDGLSTITLKDPNPRRDYINVIDVSNAIKVSIDNNNNYGKYNLCSGISYSVKEITEIINSYLATPVNFHFGESDRINEVNETIGSFDKMKFDFDWLPTISFEDGIKAIVKHYNL